MGSRHQRVRGRTERSPLAKLIERGPYFTDDVRLFRVASVVSGSDGPKFLQLEDCRTLQVSDYTAEEIALLELVPVRARAAVKDLENRDQPAARGTASTGTGLERLSPEETPPSRTLRTGP